MLLTLDAAVDGCGAGLVVAGQVVVERRLAGRTLAALPELVAEVLRGNVLRGIGVLRGVVVTVGPGSFTGVRAAIALARGIGLGAEVPVVGVTVGDAIRAGAAESVAGIVGARAVWVAIDSKRRRVFLDDGAGVASLTLGALPWAVGPVAVAGDAAAAVVSRMAARGEDVQLLGAAWPGVAGIAAAADRHGRAAIPLYVDPVEARPNPAWRPAPV